MFTPKVGVWEMGSLRVVFGLLSEVSLTGVLKAMVGHVRVWKAMVEGHVRGR